MSLSIVFISSVKNANKFHQDPSFIYRCENKGYQLQKMGHRVSYCHISHIVNLTTFDVIVFHRPLYSLHFRYLLWQARYLNKKVIAEFDDLVFDPQHVNQSPAIVNKQLTDRQVFKRFLSHYHALKKVDYITVSTEPLKEAIIRLFPNKKVCVIANAIHSTWLNLGDMEQEIDANIKQPIITYLPGTKSHDNDFATIAPTIAQLLYEKPALKLSITGPLEINIRLPKNQVEHVDKVDFSIYHQVARQGWVNLAPLEHSVFTASKSAIKVIEAAYWGKPTLCTDIPDNRRLAKEGALIYKTPEELKDKLILLLEANHYKHTVKGLRDRILQKAHPFDMSQQWLMWVTCL